MTDDLILKTNKPIKFNTVALASDGDGVKLDISVKDNRVIVTLGDGVTIDDAAHLFFDKLNMILPDWIEKAGYIPAPKKGSPFYDTSGPDNGI